MKYIMTLLILVLLSCKNDVKTKVSLEIENAEKQNVELEVYDFNGLEKFLNQVDDKVHVVNFWATWCAPCIKELPHFEELFKSYKSKGVEVILVSLDFPFQYDKKLKPFIKENKLQSKVVALDDPDMNTWMPKVNEEWTGAIPITIIYNKDKRQFYERSFTYNQLEEELKQFLN
ncbi:MAG: redoxin domain-containing protein [Flavobacteriaceae bacterium]|nr:redoxin domain-containing protein [Flavobacteriaceae bacterium]